MSSKGGSAVTSARLRLHGRRGARNISARPAAELPRLAGPAAAVLPSGADVSAGPTGAAHHPVPTCVTAGSPRGPRELRCTTQWPPEAGVRAPPTREYPVQRYACVHKQTS
ncbi:hypothetical protein Ae505Ps2_6275 [Pseudonocardia sp. Ae505_Ps2]|nr:hypothetical protein Ae505Ps2_6296 [Pseudonocardia sp. Ae505_Ps2]OLM08269.1 hypothetical protein Ae505Ps2_6275 [Pseudonocardia sp. Ae505_Ps2]